MESVFTRHANHFAGALVLCLIGIIIGVILHTRTTCPHIQQITQNECTFRVSLQTAWHEYELLLATHMQSTTTPALQQRIEKICHICSAFETTHTKFPESALQSWLNALPQYMQNWNNPEVKLPENVHSSLEQLARELATEDQQTIPFTYALTTLQEYRDALQAFAIALSHASDNELDQAITGLSERGTEFVQLLAAKSLYALAKTAH